MRIRLFTLALTAAAILWCGISPTVAQNLTTTVYITTLPKAALIQIDQGSASQSPLKTELSNGVHEVRLVLTSGAINFYRIVVYGDEAGFNLPTEESQHFPDTLVFSDIPVGLEWSSTKPQFSIVVQDTPTQDQRLTYDLKQKVTFFGQINLDQNMDNLSSDVKRSIARGIDSRIYMSPSNSKYLKLGTADGRQLILQFLLRVGQSASYQEQKCDPPQSVSRNAGGSPLRVIWSLDENTAWVNTYLSDSDTRRAAYILQQANQCKSVAFDEAKTESGETILVQTAIFSPLNNFRVPIIGVNLGVQPAENKVYIADLTTGVATIVGTEVGSVTSASINAQSNRLVYSTARGVYSLDLVSGITKNVLLFNDMFPNVTYVNLSPDGQYISFTFGKGDAFNPWIIELSQDSQGNS